MVVTYKLVTIAENEVGSRIILLYFEDSWAKIFQHSSSRCPGQ